MNNQKILLQGHHNYMNILAVFAISDEMNFPRKNTIDIVNNFPGLPHRFQTIKNEKGVIWINDSKSTNVGSTRAALKNLKPKGKIRLVLGGNSKSANFYTLKKYFIQLNIKIYCFGKDGYNISKICNKKSIYFNTLQEVMKLIAKEINSGDVVLFSPGCSSLDQFLNFEERGNIFIKLAKEIN